MASRAMMLHEVVRLLGSIPPRETFRHDTPENSQWLGAVANVFDSVSTNDQLRIDTLIQAATSRTTNPSNPRQEIVILLEKVKRSLELSLGYSIPRNYIDPSELDLDPITNDLAELRKAIQESNEIDPNDRDIFLSEIALFEASLGCARLSPELISRFVFGVLKASSLLVAGEVVKDVAGRLSERLLAVIGIS